MLDVKALIKFFDVRFLYKLFSLLLLFFLVFVIDILIILLVSEPVGRYLTLAIVLMLSFVGFFLGIQAMNRIIERTKKKVKEGIYPEEEFAEFLGTGIATVFLILPGFLSKVIGLVCFVPAVRRALGGRFTSKQGSKMKELYEYLKLYDF